MFAALLLQRPTCSSSTPSPPAVQARHLAQAAALPAANHATSSCTCRWKEKRGHEARARMHPRQNGHAASACAACWYMSRRRDGRHVSFAQAPLGCALRRASQHHMTVRQTRLGKPGQLHAIRGRTPRDVSAAAWRAPPAQPAAARAPRRRRRPLRAPPPPAAVGPPRACRASRCCLDSLKRVRVMSRMRTLRLSMLYEEGN